MATAARRPRAVVYRRRRVLLAAVFTVAVVATWLVWKPSASVRTPARAATQSTSASATSVTSATSAPASPTTPVQIDKVEATAAPWRLPEALSRSVVLAVDGRLVVYGGLQTGNTTTNAVVEIDAHTGKATQIASLPAPVHDAAGAVIGSRSFIFGGGSLKVSDVVQSVESDAAAVAGRLPAPRADLVAVQDGTRVLLVGGYDGTNGSRDVLATSDGMTFSSVGRLAVGVRYPAAGVIGGKLWVLGGEGKDGTPGTEIQMLDLATQKSTVVGRLSDPLAHSASVVLDGSLYTIGGRAGTGALDTVNRLDPATMTIARVGRLPIAISDAAVATLGDTAYVVGGESTKPLDTVMVIAVRRSHTVALPDLPGGKHPFEGQLLIADRGNNRLVLVDEHHNMLWQYPSASAPALPEGFYFPDDAFFTRGGHAIITNEEEQHTIIELSYPDGKIVWKYGTPNQPGSGLNQLNQPDDSYRLKDGSVTVADAKNCRILHINADETVAGQIGTTGRCKTHRPPELIAYPNGDTPLANGNILVSEIHGSWVDELTLGGKLVWSLKLPMNYPSDPQQIGPDKYLVADYSRPGGIYEFNREGQILYKYAPTSGEGMLDHPSLAVLLPNGLIATNDDHRQRVVIIDPTTSTIVWQYGQTDTAGMGPNQLNTPDGLDLLGPNNSSPEHPSAG